MKKETKIKTWLVLGSILFTFLILEISIRIIDPPPKRLESLNEAVYILSDNPILKYTYKPGYRADEMPFDHHHQNFTINADGFRDHEFPDPKPANVIRIIMLGDSATAGNGILNLNNIYAKQVESILNNKSTGKRYEVLNMGVGGYHTLQEVEILRTKGLKYKPDYVILGFCLNDFDPDSDGFVYNRLLHRIQNASGNVLQNTYKIYQSIWYHLIDKSRFFFFLYHRLQASKVQDVSFMYERDVLRWQNPPQAGMALLDKLQKKYNFKSYVLIIPAFTGLYSQYRYRKIHDQMIQILKQYPAVRYFDLLDDFAGINDNAEIFGNDSVHPNEYGHRVLAELITQKIFNTPLIRMQNPGK